MKASTAVDDVEQLHLLCGGRVGLLTLSHLRLERAEGLVGGAADSAEQGDGVLHQLSAVVRAWINVLAARPLAPETIRIYAADPFSHRHTQSCLPVRPRNS